MPKPRLLRSPVATTAPWLRHVNPDGSEGGFVAATAVVDPAAIIHEHGTVMPGAHVLAGDTVRDGDLVLPSGQTIRFDGKPGRPAPGLPRATVK